MDFFYVEDLCRVIEFFIENDVNFPRDINMAYEKKATLTEIANHINNLSTKKVEINVLESGMDKSYTGSAELLQHYDIRLIGLKKGIENIYDGLVNGWNEQEK